MSASSNSSCTSNIRYGSQPAYQKQTNNKNPISPQNHSIKNLFSRITEAIFYCCPWKKKNPKNIITVTKEMRGVYLLTLIPWVGVFHTCGWKLISLLTHMYKSPSHEWLKEGGFIALIDYNILLPTIWNLKPTQEMKISLWISCTHLCHLQKSWHSQD